MAYNNSIPQPTDKMKDSQNDILNNFQAIKTAFDQDHVTFDLANEGKHDKVTMPELGGIPVTLVNERAIYTKQSTRTGVAEIFTRDENNGLEVEMTAALEATPGWTIFPSGIIVKWGASTANGATTLTLPDDGDVAIPRFTTIFSVQLTIVGAGAADLDQAIRVVAFANPLQIDVFGSNRSTTGATAVNFEYLAIGN